VPVRDFEDLVAWRLAHALKCEVWAVSGTVRAARDFKFCDQLCDAAASAPSNISEGFGRFNSREFAYFLSVARASLMETRNHLIDAHDRGYLHEPDYSRLCSLARAALRATTGLMLYHQRQADKKRRR
jgi:four helix bundle protein